MGNSESRAAEEGAEIDDGANGAGAEVQEFDPQAVTGMSYWQMAKVGYQELVNAIIRPPRARYDVQDLGPAEFEYGGKQFRRTDLQLANPRGLRLECSHWEPVDADRPAEEMPCVIYLHGNASCRVEAVDLLSHLLAAGVTVFALDCAGSGLSEGEYVSLGFYEKEDVQAVVDHLRGSGRVSTLALWGRSMGAATSLLHGDRDPSIAAMVLDSAFADLHQLATEMVEMGRQQGMTVPGFVVKGAIKMIASSVKSTCGFNVRDLSPISHADRTFIPALFVAGEGDDFIRPHHSQQIHDAYAGDKNIVIVEGDHNSIRPGFLFDSATIFLSTTMQVPEANRLEVEAPSHLPPWHRSNPTWRRQPGGRNAAMGAHMEEELMRQAIAESLATASAAAPATTEVVLPPGTTIVRRDSARAVPVQLPGDYDEDEALRQALAASMAPAAAPAPAAVPIQEEAEAGEDNDDNEALRQALAASMAPAAAPAPAAVPVQEEAEAGEDDDDNEALRQALAVSMAGEANVLVAAAAEEAPVAVATVVDAADVDLVLGGQPS